MAADDGRHTEELAAPYDEQAWARTDLVTPIMEQPMVAEPTAPTMEEPSTTGPTSPDGGFHDEGDPGVEEAWDAMAMLGGLGGAGMEPAGDAPSSAAQGSPMVAEQAPSAVPPMAIEALGRSAEHGGNQGGHLCLWP